MMMSFGGKILLFQMYILNYRILVKYPSF